MNKLELIQLAFDGAERLVGDYYIVYEQDRKKIYDAYINKLYNFNVKEVIRPRDDLCIVNFAYTRVNTKWSYIFYSC